MKKYLKMCIWLVLFFLTIAYTYYFRPVVDDELFNYAFAKNILDGLVPYRDFNMIIPPLFSYMLSIVLALFGKKLILYHIAIAIMIIGITYLSSKKIGKTTLIIYLLLLYYPYTGYNIFCLFLLVLLLSIQEKQSSNILEAILISMMFLTKQTLGLLILPSIIYSKKKKKLFAIYGIVILLFLSYLLMNNNLNEFMNYCFYGMFDFTNKNNTGTGGFFGLEIVILIVLSYLTLKTKRKDFFYVLLFQIIAFPIVDYYHFVISFIPVVYLLLVKYRKKNLFVLYSSATVITFFILLNIGIIVEDNNYLYLTHYEVNNFMKSRVTYRVTSSYLLDVKKYLEEYSEYTPYILGNFSYLMKLNLNIPINKFDNINNGNMGYHGSERYIQEIKGDCSKNHCIFIMNDEEAVTEKNIQTNREILKYVKSNYKNVYSSNIFSVYIS